MHVRYQFNSECSGTLLWKNSIHLDVSNPLAIKLAMAAYRYSLNSMGSLGIVMACKSAIPYMNLLLGSVFDSDNVLQLLTAPK